MAAGGWNSTADVVKDLMRVPGRAPVDESYIVRGSRPPPLIRELQDEEELMLRFDRSERDNLQSDDYRDPDLRGIRSMIKMVEEYEDQSRNETVDANSGDVFSITKLNPNVAEFIPQATTRVSPTNESTPKNKSEPKPVEDKPDTTVPIKDVKELDEEQFNSLSNRLRNQIDNATVVQNKREKNVAIVSLLKLYAARNSENNKTNENEQETETPREKPVLLTPQYFEEKTENKVSSSKSSSTNSLRNSPITKNRLETLTNSNNEVRNSVEKVNDWLNPQSKTPKKSPLHLEPITFRRKAVTPTTSPSSSEGQITKKLALDDQYVPSENAMKLSQIYSKRARERDAASNNDVVTWNNLHEKLKERDNSIQQKRTGIARCPEI